uniref:Uncharacterized protein n=1 Tax=Trieres chinensis TaxID=1514140 RepID=A0A7S1Z8K6_TRICV
MDRDCPEMSAADRDGSPSRPPSPRRPPRTSSVRPVVILRSVPPPLRIPVSPPASETCFHPVRSIDLHLGAPPRGDPPADPTESARITLGFRPMIVAAKATAGPRPGSRSLMPS